MDEHPMEEVSGGEGTDRRLLHAEQQAAATREILEALGRAGPDPSGVLDTIIDRAGRLCRAQAAQLYLVDGDAFRLSRVSGDVPEDLPGIDGHETLRQLRDEVLASGVPVVAVTALAMAEDRDRARRTGFDGYLEKPISPRALPGQVEDFLRRNEP